MDTSHRHVPPYLRTAIPNFGAFSRVLHRATLKTTFFGCSWRRRSLFFEDMAAPQNPNPQDLAGLQQAQNVPAVPVPQAAAPAPVAVPQAAAPAPVAVPQAGDIQPEPVNNLNEVLIFLAHSFVS